MATPRGGRLGALDHALVGRCKGLLDRLRALGELGRALVRAGDDLLLGLAEDAGDVGRARRRSRLLGLRRTRSAMSAVRAPSASALSLDACGDLAIGRAEDAFEFGWRGRRSR